jgi:hypothetical protein
MDKKIKSFFIEEVEYVNQHGAVLMSGLTDITFKKRVEEFGIKNTKRENGRILYRKADIEDAIKKGWFNKWFM